MPAFSPPALDFELLFATVPAPHFVLDPDGTILASNTAMAGLLGTAAASLPGQPLAQGHAALAAAGHTLAPPAAWAAGLRAARNGASPVLRPTWAHSTTLAPSGTTAPRYWEATLQPVPGPAATGAALRYVLVRLLDISELLGSAAASTQRLAQILSQSPATVATLEGPEHRYTFTNARYDALAEHRATLGRPAAECFPEADSQGFIDLLDTVYRTGEPYEAQEMPFEFQNPANSERRQTYFNFNYQALRDDHGQITGVLAFGTDVTPQVLARREAEALQAQVRATDERLRRQAAALPIITFTTDAEGRTAYISPQWYAFTGQPPGGPWADVDAAWTEALHPDDRDRAEREIQQSITGARLGRVEVRLRGASGQYRWFLTEAVPELDAAGQLRRRYGFMLDVHELRDTRRRLEEKDQLLSQILAQAPAFIGTTEGPEHRFSFFNALYGELLSERIRLGESVAELLPELAEQGFVALLDTVYRTGETFVGHELPVRLQSTPDVPERYFDLTYLALRDGRGEVSGILSFAQDVTERVRARQQSEALAAEINRRDEQMRAITASMPVFLFNFDPNGRITYTNPYFYEYTGQDPTRPLDAAWDTLPPDDRVAVMTTAAAAMAAGQPWQATFRCRRHDGELRWFQTKAQPYADAAGRLAGFSAATVEIHELQERTHELARTRADFTALADNMAQLAWMADATGYIFWYNQQWYDYTATTFEQMKGFGWRQVHAPALVEGVTERYLACIQGGQPWEDTFPLRGHDGQYRWFLSRARPIRDPATGAVLRWFGTNTDVTELRQLQQQLSESEEELRIQAENIPQQIWTARPDGTADFYNHRTLAYLGHAVEDGGVADWLSFIHPDDRSAAQQRWETAIADQHYYEAEFRLRRHDGEYRWFLAQAQARRGPDGQVLKWYGTNTDVTELHLLQQRLSESEEELRIQAESIPQQIWTARPDGHVDFYNHRTAAYLGEATPTDRPVDVPSFVHPDDRAGIQAHWEKAIASQRYYEAEFRLRRYDGEYRWFLGQAQARRGPDGQVLKWYGTNTDVHQQRQLQEQVLASQSRFEQLLEALPEMAWTARPDGSINYHNQRWYELTGSTFEESQGWGWERFIHPDDYAETARRWHQSLATGEAFESEHRWRNQQGEYRWFLARGEAIRDEAGAIVLWAGVNTDVHEFKQVQQQLEHQNARLVRSNEDLDNFVYTASHDLKQPINNMAGIFEELTRTAYFRDPDAIKLISYFERALAQIFATIDDLGAIVQGQRQQQEQPAEDVALAPLVAEVIASLQAQVTQAGATFELDFATCPVVSFVRANLQSIFFNLISNSLKYAVPGRPVRIGLSSAPDALSGRPILTVRDNGLGIDMARFGPQLFQLFRRFHTHVEGTGMGLYLVNRIVQNHGGRLEVASTVDEGTTFQIYL